MPSSNPNEETMDWLLDDYWERLNAGAPAMPADEALDPALALTVRHLHTHDDAPGPNRAFVRRLREELTMTTAEPIVLSPRPYPHLAPPNGWIPAAIAQPRREPTRWRPVLEMIAAAVLVVALIGTYFGSDRVQTGMNALLQGDDSSGPVAMLHGNAARTGEMPGPGPEGQPALRWRTAGFGEADGVFTDPIVADGTIYVTGYRSEGIQITSLSAIDTATGEIRWSVDLDGLEAGTPAVAGDLVIVGARFYAIPGADLATPAPYPTPPGALIAFDAATGAERWRYSMGASDYYSPAVADGVVYTHSADGSLHAVDAETGAGRWQVPLGGEEGIGSAASPAVVDGVVYTANNKGILYALDAATGEVKWVVQTKGNILRTPAVADGVVYAAVSSVSLDEENASRQNGWISSFDASDGTERWSREVGNELYSTPAVAEGRVFLATGESIVAYNAETGDIAWTYAQAGNTSTSPTVVDGVIYTGGFDDNRLYAIDAINGQERWSVQLGGWLVGTPSVADGMVIASAGDGMLYTIGGSEVQIGTPIGTPLADGDASGLPLCTADPRPAFDALDLEGEPAASLVPVTNAQRHGQPAAARESDLPAGPPADAETVAAIKEMLTQANACHQRVRYPEVASFVSDDFLRRSWVAANAELNEGYRFLWSPASPDDFDVDDTRVLPDGRTGVLIMHGGALSGQFLVFVEQDGRWLIDERIEVTENPEARG